MSLDPLDIEAMKATQRQAQRRASVGLETALELYIIAHGTAGLIRRLQGEIDHLSEFTRNRSVNG